jgi:hypothetical protein
MEPEKPSPLQQAVKDAEDAVAEFKQLEEHLKDAERNHKVEPSPIPSISPPADADPGPHLPGLG